jgi:hypothetical protein
MDVFNKGATISMVKGAQTSYDPGSGKRVFNSRKRQNHEGGVSLTHCSSSTRDTDVLTEGATTGMVKGIRTSYDPGSGKRVSNSRNRTESKCEIRKSHLLPSYDVPTRKHYDEDITSNDYNGELISPKAEGFRQRLKDKQHQRRAETNTVQYLDKAVKSRPRHQFSTICAESEVVRCDSNKRTNSGVDIRDTYVHNNNTNDTGRMATHDNGAPEFENDTNFTEQVYNQSRRSMKRLQKRNRKLHRNQKRQDLINNELNEQDNLIYFNREGSPLISIPASDGNIGPRLSDQAINLRCRELAGNWAAGMRWKNRDKMDDELTVDPPSQVSDPNKNQQPRDLKHKARIMEVTMTVNGIEQKIIDNTAQEDTPVILHEPTAYNWDLNGKSLDEILDQLDKIKGDPNIQMPNITADTATFEEFLNYSQNTPSALNYKDHLDDEISEKDKDEQSLLYLQAACTDCQQEHRPRGFPIDLWPYVHNTQKPFISERWNGYDPDKIDEKIESLKKGLKISEERLYAYPYFLAQAIANLDRYEVKESDGVTPLIHRKFTHRLELLPGTRPIREKPQNFSENQKAFLRAKLNILEKHGKVMQRNGLQDEDWLHRLVLVEHPTRMEAFRTKYGTNAQQAMNDSANEYEVSQLFRLTIDCRELNKKTIIEPFPMPDNNMGKENIIGSRYMSVSDAADAFYAVGIREEDFGKTGFTALGKQWVMTVMLQGGVNSPGHFARIITETFEGVPLSKICPFQDDALCHATDLRLALENQQLCMIE